MIYLLGFALLVIAAAVVVLFAMLGELASRVPDPRPERHVPVVEPFAEVRSGHVARVWPAELPDPERCVLVVLSTICGSCRKIASQLAERPGYAGWTELGVVVSTGDARKGQEFVARNGLEHFRHLIDEGGEWVASEFDTRLSPTALAFHGGRLIAAYTFNDVEALRQRVAEEFSLHEKETAV